MATLTEDLRQMVRDIALEEVMRSLAALRGPKGERGNKGDKGDFPILGVDYLTPKDMREIIHRITPIKGVDYRDGKDGQNGRNADPEEVVSKVMGLVLQKIPIPKDGKDGKDGSPDTGEEIVKKINSLYVNPEFQIDARHIKNLPREVSYSKKRLGRGTGSAVQYYDLSSLTDGSTKTFTIPQNNRVLGVFSTQFPLIYRPDTDWTGSGSTTLTLTSAVSAPEQGQTLWILYSET